MICRKTQFGDGRDVLYTISFGRARYHLLASEIALADPVGRSMLAKRIVMMRRKIRIDLAIDTLKAMNNEKRMQVFGHFCTACGSDNQNCTCWRDE